ncbi:TPA: hypothetical protein ACE8LY_002073, partial [Neisseria gonorrhoeae]
SNFSQRQAKYRRASVPCAKAGEVPHFAGEAANSREARGGGLAISARGCPHSAAAPRMRSNLSD